MPQLTKKAFLQARELIFQFQRDACLLPPEISTILNIGAAIAFQRLQQFGNQAILQSAPRVKRALAARKKK